MPKKKGGTVNNSKPKRVDIEDIIRSISIKMKDSSNRDDEEGGVDPTPIRYVRIRKNPKKEEKK